MFDWGVVPAAEPLSRWLWRRPCTAGRTTLTEQLRLGAAVWPLGSQRGVEMSVFAWPACPCLFPTIIQLSVEQHLSSCLCAASLFMVVNANGGKDLLTTIYATRGEWPPADGVGVPSGENCSAAEALMDFSAVSC